MKVVLGNTQASPQNIKHRLTHQQAIPLLGTKEIKAHVQREIAGSNGVFRFDFIFLKGRRRRKIEIKIECFKSG